MTAGEWPAPFPSTNPLDAANPGFFTPNPCMTCGTGGIVARIGGFSRDSSFTTVAMHTVPFNQEPSATPAGLAVPTQHREHPLLETRPAFRQKSKPRARSKRRRRWHEVSPQQHGMPTRIYTLRQAIGYRNNLNSLTLLIDPVIDCIDAIHPPIDWPAINLREGDLTPDRGATVPPRLRGAYIIILNNHPTLPDTRTTFCHEVGHVIAQHTFHMRHGWDVDAGSVDDRWRIRDLERKFDASNAVRGLREQVRVQQAKFRQVQAIKLWYPPEEALIFIAHLGLKPDEAVHERAAAALLQRTAYKEIWARAYSQFVAIKSGMPELIGELEQALRSCDPSWLSEMWEWDDFEGENKIFESICALFSGRGELN